MKKLVLALAAASALATGPAMLASPAIAQTAQPAPAVKGMTVPPNATLSYNLIGLNVYDGANNSVGEIKDLVIDKGQLAGYILSVGGFLGMGERYVAVAPASIGLDYKDADKKWHAVVNATKDQLKNAPEFKYDGRFKR